MLTFHCSHHSTGSQYVTGGDIIPYSHCVVGVASLWATLWETNHHLACLVEDNECAAHTNGSCYLGGGGGGGGGYRIYHITGGVYPFKGMPFLCNN